MVFLIILATTFLMGPSIVAPL